MRLVLLVAAFVLALIATAVGFGWVTVDNGETDAVAWLSAGFAAYVGSILIGERGG